MKASPASRCKTPRYPTRLQVLADHTLLEKHLPSAWKSRAEMAGVVTFLLATNSCTSMAQKLDRAINDKPAIVAPIFEHGEGRGAVGCVVVNPPVFLSEQDAMQVIREELRNAGVDASESRVPIEGVSTTRKWSDFQLKDVEGTTPEPKPFAVDAFDPKKKVGVEYVNSQDYFDLGGGRSMSTVQDYDFRGLAEVLSKDVRAKGHGIYFGAFYDPVTAPPNEWFRDRAFQRKLDAIYSEREKAKDPQLKAEKDKEIEALYDQKVAPARAKSKRLLRMQVKDFIDWLKGQGVI